MMKMMKGGSGKKFMKQMQAMKGKGGRITRNVTTIQ